LLQREDTAYYLLFNGVLDDQRPASGNVLTTAVAEGITFKQLPHAVPR